MTSSHGGGQLHADCTQRPFFIANSAQAPKGTAGAPGTMPRACSSGASTVAEGWRIIEGMAGGCYCDLSAPDCVVKRHPCWTNRNAR
jgi:hypothetical protein